MELIHPIFKWLHIIAGVMWIGLLYFFNSSAAPANQEQASKQAIIFCIVEST